MFAWPRRVLLALALVLMLLPFVLTGFMSGMSRVRMGGMGFGTPRYIAGSDQYQGAAFCGACHPQQYQEWRSSLMANATTEAKFPHRSRQLAWAMPPGQCVTCHAPLERLGVDRSEGVTCEVCHGPGRTEVVIRNYCVVCHQDPRNFILTTAAEYAASPASQEEISCEGCHMPAIDQHSSHRFSGSRASPESYRDTVVVEAMRFEAGKGLIVAVRNTVQGHALPTGAEVNVIYLQVAAFDATGIRVFQSEYLFEKSVFFVGTMPMQITGDNRLTPGEVQEVLFPLGATPARVEAAVTIRPVGLDGVPRSFTIHQRTVTFPQSIAATRSE